MYKMSTKGRHEKDLLNPIKNVKGKKMKKKKRKKTELKLQSKTKVIE